MKKLILCMMLVAAPAWSQTKPVAKGATERVDVCAPIGQTAKRELVYSIKCGNVPGQLPPPQAQVQPPPPEPEPQRGGILGLFDRH